MDFILTGENPPSRVWSSAVPSIFRAALDVRATSIDQPMKPAASQALAALARESRDAFGPEYLPPSILRCSCPRAGSCDGSGGERRRETADS
jgi:hypothetical protein